MPQLSLEQRVTALEQCLARLLDRPNGAVEIKDWRESLRFASTDPAMQEIIAEALKIRDADRAQAQP